uniref:EF-hand domain-containing protein n=1 Tax=Globisporangium ultimum (strain ATCC 200006 / CBS 805.95 / DAOM BR144) TaxID=431595 RepID=K3XBR7_GLOUD
MATALLQYQACLGIMVRLQVEDLTLLKADFDRMGRGLSLHEFVSVMLDRVSGWEPDTVVAFIKDLVELFLQVDVNGDGTMEWEEFTSAIIEGGMGTAFSSGDQDDGDGSGSGAAAWRDLQYEEHPTEMTNRAPPKKLHFVSELRRLLLYENTRPVVEIMDPSTLFLSQGEMDCSGNGSAALTTPNDLTSTGASGSSSESNSMFVPTLNIVNHFHPLCYTTGYRRDQDEVRSERSPVQALKYLNQVELLAVSAGDLKLTFWSTTILTATSTSALETPVPLAIVHTPRPQRVLEWNAATQHLFSISADLMITVWSVERGQRGHDAKGGKCNVSRVSTLKKHTDLLQDLLVLNHETLVSCGMDNMIYLWDTTSLQVKAQRQGHRRGVRLLTKLSNQMFLSAGFECEVLAWDISAVATTPVFKLWGHTSPVCCIQLIASSSTSSVYDAGGHMSQQQRNPSSLLADQAITVDDDGWFKWWNLANVLSVDSTNGDNGLETKCLQTFRIGSDKYPWKAHSLVVLNHGQVILAAGIHKLKLLHRVRLKPKLLASSVVLYNSVSFTLLTTTDREIHIWDASSGTLLRTYRNLTNSGITCVDLDARQRKIVVGTQNGELLVLNYLNGAILKHWTPHQLNVSALLYCKEDQCVLTASWDRSLRLYDDNGVENTNALLRCITDAHDSDIKCLAYCYALGLVASGSTDGTIKIWDYIYFLLEDMWTPPPVSTNHSASSDVNALEFVEPYPLLLSCHENGLLCVWHLSTTTQPTTLMLCFEPLLMSPTLPPSSSATQSETGGSTANTNDSSSPTTSSSKRRDTAALSAKGGSISCCQVVYDEDSGELLANDIRRGRFLVLVGSNHGEVCVLDLSQVIAKSYVRAYRDESRGGPVSHSDDRSYNPRRRFLRHGKHAKRLQNKGQHKNNDGFGHTNTAASIHTSDVTCVAKWTAHGGNIRCLHTVDEPRAILTCASDKHVRIWDFDGACLGDLSSGARPQAADTSAASSTSSLNGWQWELDLESAAQAKQEQAQAIWESMKATKLKNGVSVMRHQSVVAVAREKRRTLPMTGSASASALGLQQRVPSTKSIVQDATDADHVESTSISKEGGDSQDPPSVNGASNRLFDQLQGHATWKQSAFQIARQVAWERERKRFQQRMHKIMRTKARTKAAASTQNAGANTGNQHQDHYGSDETQQSQQAALLGDPYKAEDDDDEIRGIKDASFVLPALENPAQELPFDDKDNWAVGSLNRERQMYAHLHHENVRRNEKALLSGSGSSSRLRKLQSAVRHIDLSPSPFLLDKLGAAACIVRENQPSIVVHTSKKKKKKPLVSSQSTPLLRVASSSASKTSEHVAFDPDQITPQDNRPGISATNAPHHRTVQQLMQHYDELFKQQQEEDEQMRRHASKLPTSASLPLTASAIPRRSSAGHLAVASLPELDPEDQHYREGDETHLKKVASAPTNRARSRSTTSTMATGRSIASATSMRSSPKATSKKNKKNPTKQEADGAVETASEKKQRIRSDAALLRQERFGPYTRDDIVNIYRTFHKIDKDHSGSITLRELLDGAGLFDGMHLRENIMSIFSSIDIDQSGHIDLEELCSAVFGDASSNVLHDISRLCKLLDAAEKAKKAKKRNLSPDQVKDLRALFQLYDLNRDGNIDANELLSALRYNEKFYDSSSRSGSTQMTKEDVGRIIARFDVNTNATLDISEFMELFRDES